MKKFSLMFIGCFTVLLCVTWCTCVNAAEKMGFINVYEIIRGTDTGKKAEEEFRKAVEKKRALIQEKEAELMKLKEVLDKQGPILTEKAKKEKEATYEEKFRDYQTMVKEANEEYQAKNKEIFDKMMPDIMKIVNDIGEKEKYTLIFELNGLLTIAPYYNKENDLTKRVTEEVNKIIKAKQ